MGEATRNLAAELARLLGARTGHLLGISVADAREAIGRLVGTPFVEPLGGCPVTCQDLRALGVAARQEGRPLLVDATMCGPDGCAVVRLGAHVALMGLADGCCLVALSRDSARGVPGLSDLLAALPHSEEADEGRLRPLVDEGKARWRGSSDAAQVVASYLRCHPRVTEVRYPGLKGDPSFATAARTLEHGFGPLVDVRLRDGGGWERVVCVPGDPREQVIELERRLV